MTLPTPRPPFDDGHYDRANEDWICGHAATGDACPLGPAGAGVCLGEAECHPYQRRQRWFCARSSSRGGACEEGPLPDGSCCRPITRCSPVRSILAKRRRTTMLVAAMALGVVLWIVSGPSRQQLTSAGALSFAHASLDENQCSACHDVGDGSLSELTAATLSTQTAASQSQRCAVCHQEQGQIQTPHTLNPEQLQKLTAEQVQAHAADSSDRLQGGVMLQVSRTLFGVHAEQTDLACASCHHEHQGRQADLTAMSDQQCQICHIQAFESFEHGHPALANYPHQKRSQIYFDHASHYNRHFASTGSRDCQLCHRADGEQANYLLRGFEQACAACHADQIDTKFVAGLPLFNLPRIDIAALGQGLPVWPAPSQGNAGASSRVSLLMQLLLANDSKFLKADELLQGVDVASLSGVDSRTHNVARYYATTASDLLTSLNQTERDKIGERLASALKLDEKDAKVREFTGLLPWGLLSEIPARWQESSTAQEAGAEEGAAENDEPVEPTSAPTSAQKYGESAATGWYWDDYRLALRYRPTGHADPLLKTLLELTVAAEGESKQSSTAGQLFSQLADVAAAGRCLKCHSIDRDESGAAIVNWLGRPASPRKGKFTWFSHAPHLIQDQSKECASCHEIASAVAQTADWQRFDPAFRDSHGKIVFASAATDACGFAPLSVAKCAQCHQQQAVRQSCLTCHNYHVSTANAH